MADLIQFRRDTAQRWAASNPTLAEGELGLVLGSANQYKIGDGVTPWNSLPLKGFNGNILDEFGDNYDAVISQGGLSVLFRNIVNNDSNVNLNDLDNMKEEYITKQGIYAVTDGGKYAIGHLLVGTDPIGHNMLQWLFGNFTINGGKISTAHTDGRFNIIVRTYGMHGNSGLTTKGAWTEWRYFQQEFLKTDATDLDKGEQYTLGYATLTKIFNNIDKKITDSVNTLNKRIAELFNTNAAEIESLKTKFQTLNSRIDSVEDTANEALDTGNSALKQAVTNSEVLDDTITMRFDGFIEVDDDDINMATGQVSEILFNKTSGCFICRGTDNKYYDNWKDGHKYRQNSIVNPEDNGLDKIYMYNGSLYIYDEDYSFVKVGTDYQEAIDILNKKAGSIIPVSYTIGYNGKVDGTTSNPTELGVTAYMFLKDSKNRYVSLYYIENTRQTTITPIIGQIFCLNGIYYGWNGRQFQEIGGGTGSGSGSGFYNITKEIPLENGYYTLATALEALKDADTVDDDSKKGFILTIEEGTGVWKDYRFVGSSIANFYEIASWEEYGTKGVVKKVTLLIGTNNPQEISPDGNGNVNINVPAVETDDTLDENSTNPVQNKVIANEFKNLGGKYGIGLRLNTIEEGNDKAYSLSLLDENGGVLDTTETFTGGGGGGSSLATKIVLTRLSTNPTVKLGDTVKLKYKYDQINTDTQESTGESANITVTVSRGATSNSFTELVGAGTTKEIDVTKYLGIGTNSVKVRAVVGEGEQQQVSSVSWSVNVVQLVLTSSFNIGTLVQRGSILSVPFALTGSGNKTLRCYIDGLDKEDRSISASSANGSFSIDTTNMNHGSHSVQLVAELELADGTKIKSNSIYFGIAVRVTGNPAPIIATKFEYTDGAIIGSGQSPYIPVEQYENYSIVFAAYNPKETPTTVKIYELGSLISSSSVSFILTKLDFRAMSYGEENCKIVCGSTEFEYRLISQKSELDLVEPTDNMTLKLSAQGRSNSDTNREEWTYNDVTTTLKDFTWGGDGWQGSFLRHKGNARSVVNFKPLAQPSINVNNALAFAIKFRVSEVSDYTTPVISCMDDNGTGFQITPSEAKVVSRGNSEVSMKMASGDVYEVAFVSFPEYTDGASNYEKQNSNMLYLFINGIMVGGVQRGDSDNIYQAIPQNISMGSDGATLDVYLMRAWNSFLTDNQILACYILDQDSVDSLLELYNANNILDDNGNISVESVPDGMRVVVVTGQQASGQSTVLYAAVQNNKKTKYNVDEILTFIKGEDKSERNFRLIGGCISLQGTSSLAYPVKNYRLYLYNSSKVNGQLYIGCNEQGIGGTLQSDVKYSFRLAGSNNYKAIPVNCFCLKADYAESSSSHNTGMARLVHSTLMKANELTPAQKNVNRETYQYDVRTTVDGEPCLLFYRGSINDTPIFLGKFNWNNDKSTEDVFGFKGIPGYHDADWVNTKFGGTNPTECWEFLNNDYPMGMFKDADFDAVDEDGNINWLNVFEARFPDDSTINSQYEAGTLKPKYLQAVVKWINSTDTTVSGLSSSQKADRKKKFRDELKDYFDVNYLCDYYMFTDMFACVDQRVKNMMMAFWYNPDVDKVLAYMIFYDNDTILGVRNDGRLKYDWDINEETTDPELSTQSRTVYAYAGHDSVLWKNLRENFADELGDAYRRIRAALTISDMYDYFDKQQSDKFCARIFNQDSISKYIVPKTIGVDVIDENTKEVTNKKYSYMESMQGDRKAHRHYFISNRISLFDARYSTGSYTTTDINWKGNTGAGAKVTAVAAREFYFEFKREGQSMTRSKVVLNQEWSYTYQAEANVGTIFHLYGGEWMKKLDLSSWGGFTDLQIPKLPVLEELIIGKTGNSYSLTELVIGSNLPMLKKFVMVNYTNLSTLNLSACNKLEYLDAGGCTNLSTLTFAESAPLSYFHVPANYQTLTLRSLPLITRENLIFDNVRGIVNLWIENCGKLDGFALFKELFALNNRGIKNVRLTGLSIEGDGEDLKSWYEAGIGGLDAQGNVIANHCKISGDYQLTTYLDDVTFDTYQEYFDELNIKQPQYTKINSDDTVSDDKNFTNEDNKTGYDYDNDYKPSGHVKRILSKRYACLGKQVKEGTMTIYPLNDLNSNYFADGTTLSNSTPAVLDGTQGDVFVFEPDYWYKGINDLLGVFGNSTNTGKSRKYYCFSSQETMPDVPKFKRVTFDDIKNAGNLRKGFKVKLGLSNIDSAVSSDSNYSYLKVDVSGYKYLRFPSVLGPLVGAIVVDADGVTIEEIGVASLDAKMVDGMYVLYKIPAQAKIIHFTIKNSVDWDDVILSNSDKVEDMEPDWVHHDKCLVGMFEAINIGSKIYSACGSSAKAVNNLTQPVFSAYAKQRKLQLMDWEMHKDIGNLWLVKYGRRNAQDQCGYGQNTAQRIIGSSAFLGATDTVNPNAKTEYAWYYDENGDLKQISCSHTMYYENFWGNVAEWLDKVYLSNSAQEIDGYKFANLPYVYQIVMPDGTIRRAPSTTTSGNYVKYMRHQKYMDLINVGNSNDANQNSHYCDAQWIAGGTQVVCRSVNSAYAYGGVSDADAGHGLSYAYTYVGVRLAFRGAITIAPSVSAYQALIAAY